MNQRAARLRELIARPGIVDAIGSFDVLSVRQIEAAGFDVAYIGGSSVAATDHGIPDLGLITTPELVEHARRVTAVVDIPVIADLDDGGGNPIRARRAVQLAEQAGIAGFHIEDVDFSVGKHFVKPDLSGLDFARGRLRTAAEFAECVRAAADARSDPNTVLIARTDAAGLTSLDDAIHRANAYAEAGADMVFMWALEPADVAKVVQSVPVPLMYLAHDVSRAERDQLEADGMKVLFRPSFTRSAAFRAVESVLTELKSRGELANFERGDFRTYSESVRGPSWTDLAQSYGMLDR